MTQLALDLDDDIGLHPTLTAMDARGFRSAADFYFAARVFHEDGLVAGRARLRAHGVRLTNRQEDYVLRFPTRSS